MAAFSSHPDLPLPQCSRVGKISQSPTICSRSQNPKSPTRRKFLQLSPALSLPLLPRPTTASQAPVSHSHTPYDTYATDYDALDGSTLLTRALGFDALRAELLAHARGDVLEFGIGTGQNLTRYPSAIASLTGIDTSNEMLSLARIRAETMEFPVSLATASAERTGMSAGSFDTVVDTFSLCVYDRPRAALREMRRIVKKDGQVLLLEHCRSGGIAGWYQDVSAATVKSLSKGCVPNQRVRQLAEAVGFRVMEEKRILGGSVVALRLV